MFFMILFLLFLFFLLLMLQLIAFMLSDKIQKFYIREEFTPYECGFEMSSDVRLPFSMRYFLLTLIFLIFDLEILYLLFIPYTFFMAVNFMTIFIILTFLFLLFFGLLYEWKSGSLDWVAA